MARNDVTIVIITDLDGSLLHPKTYSYEAATPALGLIKKHNIPLVLSSSKTRAEIELYRKRLKNNHPFVSENGGGVFIPEDYFPFNIEEEKKEDYFVINLGTPYLEVRKAFNEIKSFEGANAMGFGDITVDEVSKITNMTIEEASLAKEREFDEPFIFNGTENDKKRFIMKIENRGFNWTEGRFLHMLGNHDKGKAARIIIDFYKKLFGKVATIGIGDSLNDIPLLEEADYPVLIPKEDGSYVPGVSIAGLVMADAIGPEGWNKSVIKILEKI